MSVCWLAVSLWPLLGLLSGAAAVNPPSTPICPADTAIKYEYEEKKPSGYNKGWKWTGPNCHYHYFTQAEVASCLSGRWILLMGGSNCVSTSAQLHQIANGAPFISGKDMLRRAHMNQTYCCQPDVSKDCTPVPGDQNKWWDALFDANGNRLAVVADTNCTGLQQSPSNVYVTATIVADNLKLLTDGMKAAGPGPPGSFRITYIAMWKFPLVKSIIDEIRRSVTWLPLPVIHLSIGVWYKFNGGGGANVARENLLTLLETYRKAQPDVHLTVRDQAYAYDDLRAALRDATQQYMSLNLTNGKKEMPNLYVMKEGGYSPSGGVANQVTAYDDIWKWDMSNHPRNAGGLLVAYQYLNIVCTAPSNPVAYEVLYTRDTRKDQYTGCNHGPTWDPDGCYYEYAERICSHYSEMVNGMELLQKPVCLAGQQNNYIWTNVDPVHWDGSCYNYPCPQNAANAPNCACKDGYVDTLSWNLSANGGLGGYSGSCFLADCPAHASGQPKCVCDSGYEGAPTWNNGQWQGTPCAPILCPQNADGAGPNCICRIGYSGILQLNGNTWTGQCDIVKCPGEVSFGEPKCACPAGYLNSITWQSSSQSYSGQCAVVQCPGNVAYDSPSCTCPQGYKNTLVWQAAPVYQYTGGCADVSCIGSSVEIVAPSAPKHRSCLCPVGLSGTVSWQQSTESFIGGCSVVNCIANAHATVCNFGGANVKKYLGSCPASGCGNYASLAVAQTACCSISDCNGVTQNSGGFQLKQGTTLFDSPSGETSWLKQQASGCVCNEGYSGSVSWDAMRQVWPGACILASCPVHSSGSPCACATGYRETSPMVWNGASWGGTCMAVACPTHSSGAPNCKCATGYVDTLGWSVLLNNGDYTGNCELAVCPANATGAPACSCRTGFEGQLQWKFVGQINGNNWQGACSLSSCPPEATGAPDCACVSGFKGNLSWNTAFKLWEGACSFAACPDFSTSLVLGNTVNCECLKGYKETTELIFASDKWVGSCSLVPCPTHAEGIPCKCLAGYVDSLAWDFELGRYNGSCNVASCLPGATGTEPNCACLNGFSGATFWSFDEQRWMGSCVLEICPWNASGAPDCQCLSGFSGRPVWSPASQKWDGICSPASCPLYAAGNPCACLEGYRESVPLVWGGQSWTGSCSTVACPTNALGTPCQCQTGFVDTLSFDFASESYLGNCSKADCPQNASGPSCQCNIGYLSTVATSWSFVLQTWLGACELAPCPEQANHLRPDQCQCQLGYEAVSVSFIPLTGWKGYCRQLSCPAPAVGGGANCSCPAGYMSTLSLTSAGWEGDCQLAACPSNSRSIGPGSAQCVCKEGYAGSVVWDNLQRRYQSTCVLQPCPANLTEAPACGPCPVGYVGYISWNGTDQTWIGTCTPAACPRDADWVNQPSAGAPSALICRCNYLYSGVLVWRTSNQRWQPSACVVAVCPSFSKRPSALLTAANHTSNVTSGPLLSGDDDCRCDKFYSGTVTWAETGNKTGWQGNCKRVPCPPLSNDDSTSGCGCSKDQEGQVIWKEWPVSTYVGQCTPARPLALFINDPTTELEFGIAATGSMANLHPKSWLEQARLMLISLAFLFVSAIVDFQLWPRRCSKLGASCCLMKKEGWGDSEAVEVRTTQNEVDREQTVEAVLEDGTTMTSNPLADVAEGGQMATVLGDGDMILTQNPLAGKHLEVETADKEGATRIRRGSNTFLQYRALAALTGRIRNMTLAAGSTPMDWGSDELDSADGFSLREPQVPLARTKATSCVASPATMSSEVEGRFFVQQGHRRLSQIGAINKQTLTDQMGTVLFGKLAGKASLRLEALGPARFLASVHIVAGHLVDKKPSPVPQSPAAMNIAYWGFTWVPWYMMLSAFVLSYSRAVSPDPHQHMAAIPFTLYRLHSIYPLYLCGLFAAAGLSAFYNQTSFSLGTPWETVAQLLLLQAWVPNITENVYQAHAWFLSCIVPYWLLHRYVYLFLSYWTAKKLTFLLLFLTMLPMFGLWLIPPILGEPLDWYDEHVWSRTTEPVDTAVLMLKFHPIAYFPTYVYGVAVGLLFVKRGVARVAPFWIRWGAMLGCSGLFFVFLMGPYFTLPAYKLSARLGVLAPLHALLLMGLSADWDPLAKLLSNRNLSFLGDLSFPQYIFQFIAYSIWQPTGGLDFGYWAFLLVLAVCGHVLVNQPLAPWTASKWTRLRGLVGLGVLPCLIVWVTSLAGLHAPVHNIIALPDSVNYANGMQDIRLKLQAPASSGLVGGQVINPSLLLDPSGEFLWVAARWHRLEQTISSGIFPALNASGFPVNATQLATRTWYSRLLLGKLNVTTLTLLEDMIVLNFSPPHARGEEWKPCVLEYSGYSPGNNSVTQVLSVGGHEDPRLYLSPDASEVYVTFHGLPPAGAPIPDVGESDYVKPEKVAKYLQDPTFCLERGRFYRAILPAWVDLKSNPAQRIATNLLAWDQGKTTMPEKNWMSFLDPTERPEHHFVRTLEPFRVVAPAPQLGGVDVHGKQLLSSIPDETGADSQTFFPRLTVSKKQGEVFHGGANALRIEAANPYYIASFHSQANGTYKNYLFRFSPTPPYNILAISGLLPLLGAPPTDVSIWRPLAFSSGLAFLLNGSLAIAYGSSNTMSRLLVVPYSEYERFFIKDD